LVINETAIFSDDEPLVPLVPLEPLVPAASVALDDESSSLPHADMAIDAMAPNAMTARSERCRLVFALM
jgi:hypothetical protein